MTPSFTQFVLPHASDNTIVFVILGERMRSLPQLFGGDSPPYFSAHASISKMSWP